MTCKFAEHPYSACSLWRYADSARLPLSSVQAKCPETPFLITSTLAGEVQRTESENINHFSRDTGKLFLKAQNFCLAKLPNQDLR